MQRKAVRGGLWLLLALTLGFIWGNSLLPVHTSLEISGSSAHLLELFLDVSSPFGRFVIENVRKIAHFAEFTLLGIEIYLLHCGGRRSLRGSVWVLSAGLWVAVADEALQLLSQRGPQIGDVLLDVGGVLHGVLWTLAVLSLIGCIRKRRAAKAAAAQDTGV